MKGELIETYYHEGVGYNPFFIKDQWQVAQLNYLPELDATSIEKVEMHQETDEVFILTKGTAVMIAANEEMGELRFELIKMKIGVTYNIPVNSWHNIAMEKDAEVIIVEKSNTHLSDVLYRNLSAKEKEYLKNEIRMSLQEEL